MTWRQPDTSKKSEPPKARTKKDTYHLVWLISIITLATMMLIKILTGIDTFWPAIISLVVMWAALVMGSLAK